MLNDADIKLLTNLIKVVVKDTVREEIQPLERTMDKVLKVVTRESDEHKITKSRVSDHTKRIAKIEKKIQIKSSVVSTF